MANLLLEIMKDPFFCIGKSMYAGLSAQVLDNVVNRVALDIESPEAEQQFLVFKAKTTESEGSPMVKDYVGDADRIVEWEDLEDEDRIVSIVRLNGVMTRGGGACSYGSMDIRNKLMRAADLKHTTAHIIVANTPGGMASSLRDFRYAINYCHERGQKVYMYADGDIASGGAFLSAMCDGTYFLNSADEIGSLGMYCAFFTSKDGDQNAITKETYREYYAEASPDKNKFYRTAAQGDMSDLEEMVNKDLAQILANLRKDRPSIKSEHMTGAMYQAGTVVGSLVDGFCTLQELAAMALDEHTQRKGAALPLKEVATPVTPSKTGGCNPDKKKTNTNQITDKNMEKQYVHLPALIGEEPYACDSDGNVNLQAEQADALEARAQEIASQMQTLDEEVTALKQDNIALTELANEAQAACVTATNKATALTEQNAQLAAQVAQLTASLAEATATAETQEQTITSQEEVIGNQQETIATLQEAIATHEETIATNATTINDLQTSLKELDANPGAEVEAGASAADNGMSAEKPKSKLQKPVHDFTKSMTDNKRIMDEYLEALAKEAYSQK